MDTIAPSTGNSFSAWVIMDACPYHQIMVSVLPMTLILSKISPLCLRSLSQRKIFCSLILSFFSLTFADKRKVVDCPWTELWAERMDWWIWLLPLSTWWVCASQRQWLDRSHCILWWNEQHLPDTNAIHSSQCLHDKPRRHESRVCMQINRVQKIRLNLAFLFVGILIHHSYLRMKNGGYCHGRILTGCCTFTVALLLLENMLVSAVWELLRSSLYFVMQGVVWWLAVLGQLMLFQHTWKLYSGLLLSALNLTNDTMCISNVTDWSIYMYG